MITWPPHMPCFQVAGFSEGSQDAVIRTAMDVGYPQARSTHSDPVWFVNGSIVIPYHEWKEFYDFYEISLKDGSLRFQMDDPIDGTSWNWRFTKPFTMSMLTTKHMTIGISLERIPQADLAFGDDGLIDAAKHHLVDDHGRWLGA